MAFLTLWARVAAGHNAVRQAEAIFPAHILPLYGHVTAQHHCQFPARSVAMDTFESGHEQRSAVELAELLGQIASVARSASSGYYNVDIPFGLFC